MQNVNPDNLIADDTSRPDPLCDCCCDPITGAPHSHPVGTGVGAAVGAAVGGIAGGPVVGALIGAGISGPAAPIGAVVGAVVATIAGAAAGHAMARAYEGSDHDLYWRENYATRPYFENGLSYDHYAPAYRYGWEAQRRYAGRDFDEVESDLAVEWERFRGDSALTWDKAKSAARDAWERMRAGGQEMGNKSTNPEPLTPADVVQTPADSGFVRTPESERLPGRDVATTDDVAHTDPDRIPGKPTGGDHTLDGPDDATGRSIRDATLNA